MSEHKVNDGYQLQDVFIQEGTFDGKWILSIDPLLLMNIINHRAAESEAEIAEMADPKRISVKVIIETKVKI